MLRVIDRTVADLRQQIGDIAIEDFGWRRMPAAFARKLLLGRVKDLGAPSLR
jgi:hypothetical protein